jgi:hypothetical protein
LITTRREAREKRHFLSPIPLKMIGRSLRQRISGPHRTRPDHLRGLSKGNDMADSSILMPGASEAYREARDRLFFISAEPQVAWTGSRQACLRAENLSDSRAKGERQ